MVVDRIIGDRVLVRLKETTNVTKSGIVLPDKAASMQPRLGEVASVGYLLTPDGHYRPCLRVSAGEWVLLPARGGMEIDVSGERLWVFDANDVLAVIKNSGLGLTKDDLGVLHGTES